MTNLQKYYAWLRSTEPFRPVETFEHLAGKQEDAFRQLTGKYAPPHVPGRLGAPVPAGPPLSTVRGTVTAARRALTGRPSREQAFGRLTEDIFASAGRPFKAIWNAPWGEMERRTKAFWGRKVGRQNPMFLPWGVGGAAGALIGGAAGAAFGGGPGMIGGMVAGAYLGTKPTGFQAAGFGAFGGLLGMSVGGPVGGLIGATAGAVVGGLGPGHMTKQIWKSGKLGKAGLIGAGSLAAGAMMFGGPGIDAETMLGMGAGAATLGATVAAPLLGVGITGGIMAAAKGGGLKGFGAAMGGRWGAGAVRKTAHLASRSPVKMAGLLGMTMGLWSLGKGVADMAMDNRNAIGSMAAGSIEGRYGMDPNNLDTQGLTLALHYRHM